MPLSVIATALQMPSVCCTNLNEQHMQRFGIETPYPAPLYLHDIMALYKFYYLLLFSKKYNLAIAVDKNFRKLVPLVVTLYRKLTT